MASVKLKVREQTLEPTGPGIGRTNTQTPNPGAHRQSRVKKVDGLEFQLRSIRKLKLCQL